MELASSLLLNEAALEQLSAPKKPIFILEWLRYLDQILPVAEKGDIKESQKKLVDQLISLVNSGLGPPSRLLLARCLATLFTVGDAYYVFEAVNSCNDVVKVKDDSPNFLPSRLTALCCLAAMYKSLGRLMGRSFEETTQVLIRCLRNAESQTRAEVMTTFAAMITGLGSACSSVHKEIYKVARPALTDRQMTVRCAACSCIEALVVQAPFLWTQELESLCSCCFKALDGSNLAVRSSVASLLAAALATAHCPPSQGSRVSPGQSTSKGIAIEEVWSILGSGFLRGGLGFLKTNTSFHGTVSKEIRVGISITYVQLVNRLGVSWLEKHLSKYVRHLFDLAANSCGGSVGFSEASFLRHCVCFALGTPLQRMLSEKMQIVACKEIGQVIAEHMNSLEPLDDSDPDRCLLSADMASSQHSVCCLLLELSDLVVRIGSIVAPLFVEASGILEPVFSVLSHPCTTCRLASAWCLRSICIVVPGLMTPLIERCLLRLEHSKGSACAVAGYSGAAAALTVAIHLCPLGIPSSKCKRIVQVAVQLLRTAPHDSKLAMVKTESGWLLLSALVTMGPVTVQPLLPRILAAVKSIFPRSKKEAEEELNRGDQYTWQVTLASRAGALSVVKNLVVHCKGLVNDDIVQKLLIPLESAFYELELLPNILKLYGQQLRKYAALFKQRLFEALVEISPSRYIGFFALLLREVIVEFTVIDGSSSSQSNFLLNEFCCNEEAVIFDVSFLLCANRRVEQLVNPLSQRSFGSLENAAFMLCNRDSNEPPHNVLSSQVALTNSALLLFGHVFPFVQSKHRIQLLDHFGECVRLSKSSKQAAIQGNVIAALILSLKNLADGKLSLESNGNLVKTALSLITQCLASPSVSLRYCAAEAFGRLAQVAPDPQFLAEMVQLCYDKLKLCRDAASRMGHSMALGCLHRYVGGLASGHQLDVSVSVLLALAQDNTSLPVEIWALNALGLIADSGGPMYRSFVEPTLGICVGLLLSSSFCVADIGKCVSRLVAALITTVGPELQVNTASASALRTNFLVAAALMGWHSDPFVQAQSIGCFQQLYLFAPRHVNLSVLVSRLCQLFSNQYLSLRRASFSCLRQLVQREAREVHHHAQTLIPEGLNATRNSVLPETGLEGALFAALDVEEDPTAVTDLKEILINLVQTLGSENLSLWLDLCKEIIASADSQATRESDADQQKTDGGGYEEEMWHVSASDKEMERSSRWTTRVFAVEMVKRLIASCEGERAHFDLALAKELQLNGGKGDYLVLHLADLVRLSFMAATSDCTSLRLVGLSCLEAVISKFSHVADPELAGHFLLEQFQAQVSAALRPAFSDDTPANVTALACQVCSSWIGSGVAKDMNDLRRVHQLLVAPLVRLKQESVSVHLYNESSIALEKLAILKAWAEVRPLLYPYKTMRGSNVGFKVYIVAMRQDCSSKENCYSETLLELVNPELSTLIDHWLGVLKDFALLSLPGEFASQLPEEGAYFTLSTAELVKPFYKDAWAAVLLAASTWLSNNNFEFSSPHVVSSSNSYSKEDWFYILIGISMETLCNPRNVDVECALLCLNSIRTILSNEWAQLQLLANPQMSVELLNVLYRLILSREALRLQSLCIDITKEVVEAAELNCKAIKDRKTNGCSDSGPKLYNGDEGADSGAFKIRNSLVYASLEVILCLLVRQAPKISPTVAKSKTFLAQRKSSTLLSHQSQQLMITAVGCLSKLPALCSEAGKLTILPIVFYLLTNTFRETSKIESAASDGSQLSAAGSTLSGPAAACLKAMRELLKMVVYREGSSIPNGDWVRIVQCAIWSLLEMDESDRAEQAEVSRISLLVAVAVFVLNAPKAVLMHPHILERCALLFKRSLQSDDPTVRIHCLQTLVSIFSNKEASVASYYIRSLTPSIVDQIKAHMEPSVVGLQLSNDFKEQSDCVVLIEALRVLECLVHAANEDQRLPLLVLVSQLLVALLVEDVRTAVARRQLFDFALERLNALGTAYPADFKALLTQMPSLKARLETAVRRSVVEQQQQHSTAVESKVNNSAAASAAGRPNEPSIALTMDFSNYVQSS
ncbi:HEAT repeat containing protein 5B [Trichuris trichiura]|uniref:HEAT repeat containing protein 5B n=1 Tax=Trichuris trichiura TaxID=36087 RepID=A0A077YWK9_TRITR|nr:HEAT repeat containing protein 5B [Trichuris trichiura]